MIEYYTTKDSEVCHETIQDAIFGVSQFPVEILVVRRMKPNASALADCVLERLLEDLDEDFGDPDGDPTPKTPAMQSAAQAFVESICKDYIPWSCEETGERFWVDKDGEKVKGKI